MYKLHVKHDEEVSLKYNYQFLRMQQKWYRQDKLNVKISDSCTQTEKIKDEKYGKYITPVNN